MRCILTSKLAKGEDLRAIFLPHCLCLVYCHTILVISVLQSLSTSFWLRQCPPSKGQHYLIDLLCLSSSVVGTESLPQFCYDEKGCMEPYVFVTAFCSQRMSQSLVVKYLYNEISGQKTVRRHALYLNLRYRYFRARMTHRSTKWIHTGEFVNLWICESNWI